MNLLKISTPFVVSLFLTLPAHALHVVIDPGHGGSDVGAVANGIKESHLTLKVSQYLAEELDKDTEFTYTLTRDKDEFIPLEVRASLANTKGDVFISIHANSSQDSRARGKEIYFQNQLQPDEEALYLASRENSQIKSKTPVAHYAHPVLTAKPNLKTDVRSIIEDLNRNHALRMSGLLTEKIYHHWNGTQYTRQQTVRQAPFFVISNTDKPSALIEIGYLTNPIEAKKLSDPDYLRDIAVGIYRALVSFKEFVDKPTPKSLN